MTAPPSSLPPHLEHVRGLDALPFVERALARFDPAVLLTAEGLGAIHAAHAPGNAPGARTLWFLADARTLLEWESQRRQVVTLTFQSPDERIYFTLSGRTEVVTDHDAVTRLWKPTFRRWFPAGAGDPRLLLVRFSAYDADFYETSAGRISTHVVH